jgi:hypothetical protein
MSQLTDLVRQFGNMTLSPAAVLAINAASALTVKTTNAITYLKDGKLSSKAALAAVALAAPATTNTKCVTGVALTQAECDPWRFYQLPAGKTCYIALALDNAGAVVAFQGDYAGQALNFRGGGVAKGSGNVPTIPDGFIPFGLIKIVSTTGTFTPATTALDAANLTFTFSDISLMPSVNP